MIAKAFVRKALWVFLLLLFLLVKYHFSLKQCPGKSLQVISEGSERLVW